VAALPKSFDGRCLTFVKRAVAFVKGAVARRRRFGIDKANSELRSHSEASTTSMVLAIRPLSAKTTCGPQNQPAVGRPRIGEKQVNVQIPVLIVREMNAGSLCFRNLSNTVARSIVREAVPSSIRKLKE